MLSILEEPQIRQHACPVSVECYHEMGRLGLLDKNVELLEGVIVYKTSKSALHETLVEYLRRLLEAAAPEGTFVGKERPITCARSEPEPDLALFAGDWRDFRKAHPGTAELVIEVSLSTLAKDLLKAASYAGAGVKEYWVVDPESKSVTIMTSPVGEAYRLAQVFSNGVAVSSVVDNFQVELGDLFVE